VWLSETDAVSLGGEEDMQKRKVLLTLLALSLSVAGYVALVTSLASEANHNATNNSPQDVSSGNTGALQVIDPEKGVVAECPLKRTDVKAEVSGFLARVIVTQQFENPFKDKIEAVYTFPLPQNAAVDDMTMRVGGRTVRGRIKPREEARAIYDAARAAGNVASLLDQERPNIFTQSVANIMPGEKVDITISYVETLKYEEGTYEFVFPMVVGPRYIPGQPTGKQGGGWSPDTTRVPDASRITPPVAPKGTRAGHDISLEIALDAGVPIESIKSTQHEVELEKLTTHSAFVRLKNSAVIPNKDFILRYDVSGRRIEDAVITHSSDRGGFFTMILQPPDRVTAEDVTPKELVFVLDTSGSMSGFPIEKAKEAMKHALDGLYPQDTFNLITFAGDTHVLFPDPVPATPENMRKAQEFLASRSGGGGTEMMKAIRTALDPSDSQQHIRIVCFMTDGYVGNDMEIVSEIQKHPNARVFSFGIGSSVNRFLLDKMAEHGRGEVEYVSLQDDGSAAAKRFHERIRSPLLTDITVDWDGLQTGEIYPKRIPDLFSAKPVVLYGRYTGGGRGVIKLKGKMSGRDIVRDIPVELPQTQPRHDVVATLWARARIDELMSQDYAGIQQGNPVAAVKEQITNLGIEFRLMTQFTSFVAVEEMIVTDGGEPRRVEVPVEMPEGVSHEGVFGKDKEADSLGFAGGIKSTRMAQMTPGTASPANTNVAVMPTPPAQPRSEARRDTRRKNGRGSGGGVGAGKGSGVGAGSGTGVGPRSGSAMGGGTFREGGGDAAKPLTPEEQKRQQMLSRMHPSIAALVERLKDKTAKPAAAEAKFVRNGKAELQVWLADTTPETIAALKQLGFEIVLEPKSAKMLIGRIALDKLATLVEHKAVRYVSPMNTN
jgi:Ca-activated chloride channel family protein